MIIPIDHAFFHHKEYLFGLADIFRGVVGDGHDIREFAISKSGGANVIVLLKTGKRCLVSPCNA